MRSHTILAVTAAVALACLGLPAASAQDAQDEGYRHGRLRLAEPRRQPAEGERRERGGGGRQRAVPARDRVWTDANGRADFQFPDGSVVRLDRRSKLDYAGHEEDRGERIALRLWSGSLILRVGPRAGARFEIETPAGSVQGLARSVVRADVDAGALRVSVYAGEATLDDGREPVRLAAGERSYARWASEPRSRSSSTWRARRTISRAGTPARSPRRAGRRAPPSTCPKSSTPTRASSTPTESGATRSRSVASGHPAWRSVGGPTRTDAGAGRPTAGPGCQ